MGNFASQQYSEVGNPSFAYPGRLIFDHLPKTGGQAVFSWLRDSLGSGIVVYVAAMDASVRNVIRKYGGRYSIICGHFIYANRELLDSRYQYVTLLRDPVERALSWISYLINNNHPPSLLRDQLISDAKRFLDSDGQDISSLFRSSISNYYFHHFSKIDVGVECGGNSIDCALAALSKYSLVGVYDRLDVFVANFAHLIGVNPPDGIAVVNRTVSKSTGFSKKLLSRLRELNRLDIAIYQEIFSDSSSKFSFSSGGVSRNSYVWSKVDLPQPFVLLSDSVIVDLLVPSVNPSYFEYNPSVDLLFSFRLTVKRKLRNPYVCIHFIDSDGQRIFATNSALLGFSGDLSKSGCYKLTFAIPLVFPIGRYFVGLVVFERTKTKEFLLSWNDNICEFNITYDVNRDSSGICPVSASLSVVNI